MSNPTPSAAPDTALVDALVIGGGPAGLQAALTLGRIHRSAVLVDSGIYRNAPVTHMHNVVTHDGRPPADFRASAREQLAPYDVELLAGEVVTVAAAHGSDGPTRFEATLADGRAVVARRVVLATGLRDDLPAVPGLDELWGTLAAQCPFCHGHEFSGGHVAVLGGQPKMMHAVGLMGRIAGRITALTHGTEVDAETGARLTALGAGVVTTPVERFSRDGDVARAHLADGMVLDLAGVFLAPTYRQSAPFAEQLGVALLDSGCVQIDDFGRTSVPGVYAAGDLAHRPAFPMPMPSVVGAIAAGQMAGVAVSADALGEDMAAIG